MEISFFRHLKELLAGVFYAVLRAGYKLIEKILPSKLFETIFQYIGNAYFCLQRWLAKPKKSFFSKGIRGNKALSVERVPDVKKGVSALVRVKDEEENIEAVIKSISSIFDEIVVVDNRSSDSTYRILRQLSEQIKSIKLFSYDYSIEKCGLPTRTTSPKSLRSLSFYYNYGLAQCSYSHVVKWDGDMICSSEHKKKIIPLIDDFIEGDDDVCLMSGELVIDSSESKSYKTGQLFREPRFFKNTPDIYYTQNIFLPTEVLLFPFKAKMFSAATEEAVFYEMKSCLKNEMSHWEKNPDKFLSKRKHIESQCMADADKANNDFEEIPDPKTVFVN